MDHLERSMISGVSLQGERERERFKVYHLEGPFLSGFFFQGFLMVLAVRQKGGFGFEGDSARPFREGPIASVRCPGFRVGKYPTLKGGAVLPTLNPVHLRCPGSRVGISPTLYPVHFG